MSDRELFVAALERLDPDRQAWLDQACADPEQRRRLNVLLRAHEMASQFLAVPTGPVETLDPAKAEPPEVDVVALLAPADKPGLLGKLGAYEVLAVVGRGAMGVVVKAFDPALHRVVAIKLLAPHLAANAAARRRFEREARAVAAVRDDHVVAIHGVEPNGPTPHLVMEFIAGVSLQDRLDQRGPLETKEILRIGMQAALGLAAAHAQGLVHRDIKPANILLENGVERVKITDFGLARAVDDVSLTRSGVLTGTPNYMSPEQADGRAVDARSDLFSLGSVLYALAAGHPPFRADGLASVLKRVAADDPRPLREVNPDVPDWLDAIVRKLHAKDPAARFQTASEVAELLGQHLAHLQQPGQVPRPARVEPPADERQPVTLRVQATGNGRVVRWGPFKQGRLVDTAGLARLFLPTVTLTDVVTDLCELAESLDGGYQMVVPVATGMTSTSFQMLLLGRGFEVRCVRQLVRGGFPANPLAAEFGANYDVVVTVNASSAEARAKVLGLLESKYLTTKPSSASRPPDDPTPRKPATRPPQRKPSPDGARVALWVCLSLGFLAVAAMTALTWDERTSFRTDTHALLSAVLIPACLVAVHVVVLRGRLARRGEPVRDDAPPEPPARPAEAEALLNTPKISLRHVLLWAFTMLLIITEGALVLELFEDPTNRSLPVIMVVSGVLSPLFVIWFYFASRPRRPRPPQDERLPS